MSCSRSPIAGGPGGRARHRSSSSGAPGRRARTPRPPSRLADAEARARAAEDKAGVRRGATRRTLPGPVGPRPRRQQPAFPLELADEPPEHHPAPRRRATSTCGARPWRTSSARSARLLAKVEEQLRERRRAPVAARRGSPSRWSSVRHSSEQLPRPRRARWSRALRRPEARGRWGELQLRRVAEIAGMARFCDFDEQVTAMTPDGPVRPDYGRCSSAAARTSSSTRRCRWRPIWRPPRSATPT